MSQPNFVALGDVAEITAGGGAPQEDKFFTEKGFPFIRAGSLIKLLNNEGESSLEQINEDNAKIHGLKLYPKDSVLFAKSGMSATKGHVYRTKQPCYVVNHLAVIIPNKLCDASYIEKVLKKYSPVSLIQDPAYPSIRLSDIAKLKIPLPPLAEQKRIAEILDKAAAIKAKRELAIAKLDELAQSTFVDMFEKKLLQSDKTVGDFFEVNNNRYMTNLNDTDEVPFIPMSAVSESSKLVENAEIRKYLEVKKGYTPIKKGDLIVAKITPCYENGKQAVVNNIEPLFAYGSTEFHTFRHDDSGLIFVLHYYLQTWNVKRKGAASMKGAAGQRRVPDSFFKELPFALLPAESVEEFKSIINKCNSVRSKFVGHVAAIEKLIASLQHQAFTTGFNA